MPSYFTCPRHPFCLGGTNPLPFSSSSVARLENLATRQLWLPLWRLPMTTIPSGSCCDHTPGLSQGTSKLGLLPRSSCKLPPSHVGAHFPPHTTIPAFANSVFTPAYASLPSLLGGLHWRGILERNGMEKAESSGGRPEGDFAGWEATARCSNQTNAGEAKVNADLDAPMGRVTQEHERSLQAHFRLQHLSSPSEAAEHWRRSCFPQTL